MLITKSQVAYLGNTLNEVAKDFHAGDFYIGLGVSQQIVEQLWDKLDSLYLGYRNDESRELALSSAEFLILRHASLLCIEKLNHDEFQTRLGASPATAQKFLQLLDSISDGQSSRN